MIVTSKLIKKWIDLYVDQKMNVVEIARLYPNVSRCTIRKALIDSGVSIRQNIHHNKYYKKKYQIGIYDENDRLVWLFDNAYDMANFFKITLSKAYSTLQPDHIDCRWYVNDTYYYKRLIEVDDEC